MNDVCASAILVEVLKSRSQFINNALYISIAFLTVAFSLLAVKALFQCQIFPWTTRVVFFVALCFANLHEVVTLVIRSESFYKSLAYTADDPCLLVKTAQDCRKTLFLSWMAVAGMVLSNSALTIDRLIATIFPKSYQPSNVSPGIILSVTATVTSALLTTIMFEGEDYDGYVPYCSHPPGPSLVKAEFLLKIFTTINTLNICINVLVIISNKRIAHRIRYNLKQRYRTHETLVTTRTVSFIAIAQFVALGIYTSSLLVVRTFPNMMSPYWRTAIIPWLYTPTYASLLLPLLIIKGVDHVGKRRRNAIKNITNVQETQDNRMRELDEMWK